MDITFKNESFVNHFYYNMLINIKFILLLIRSAHILNSSLAKRAKKVKTKDDSDRILFAKILREIDGNH